MAILRINAIDGALAMHRSRADVTAELQRVMPEDGPILIMVHGYKFAPGSMHHCPHTHIFSLGGTDDCPKALSWPRHMGFGRGRHNEGLCIAFGWAARGTLWRAHDSAKSAALSLARLVRMIRHIDPTRRVHILAHSLGGYLSLRAVHHMQAGDVDRVILMNAAAYQSQAERALATPAGTQSALLNMTSRENAAYDFLYECLVRADERRDRALGRGFHAPNALSIRLDCPETLARLAALGFRIAPRHRRVCHWSTYLRPGIFPFYQAMINHSPTADFTTIKTALDQAQHPQTSRKIARAKLHFPLFGFSNHA